MKISFTKSYLIIMVLVSSSAIFADTVAHTIEGGVAPAVNTKTGVTPPSKLVTATPQLSTNDADLTTNVQAKLVQDFTLAGASIKVMTNGGVVTLDGTVNTQAQADRAISIAKSVEGVKDVTSKLTLNNTTTNPTR